MRSPFHFLIPVTATMLLTACGTEQPSTPIEPTERRFVASADGMEYSIWIQEKPDTEGKRVVTVHLDDPELTQQQTHTSTAKAVDSILLMQPGTDGRPITLLAGLMKDAAFHGRYTPVGRSAMDLVFADRPDDLIALPYPLKKEIAPTTKPTEVEGGGYEEMGLEELGQTIELDMLRLLQPDGRSHTLNTALEEAVCGAGNTYEQFMESKVGGPAWYESGASIHYRGPKHIVFRISYHEQYPGAAHGMYGSRYVNCDRATGEVFGLWDVVDRRKRTQLIKVCSQAFYAQNPETDRKQYPFKLSETVAILGHGIEFHYQPYEMGPFVEGEKSVYVPFTELQALFLPGAHR